MAVWSGSVRRPARLCLSNAPTATQALAMDAPSGECLPHPGRPLMPTQQEAEPCRAASGPRNPAKTGKGRTATRVRARLGAEGTRQEGHVPPHITFTDVETGP